MKIGGLGLYFLKVKAYKGIMVREVERLTGSQMGKAEKEKEMNEKIKKQIKDHLYREFLNEPESQHKKGHDWRWRTLYLGGDPIRVQIKAETGILPRFENPTVALYLRFSDADEFRMARNERGEFKWRKIS